MPANTATPRKTPVRPRPTKLPTTVPQTEPPREPAGRPDPNAIVNDALKRRLVSITVLYTLAAVYKEKLAEKDKEIAKLPNGNLK